MSYDEYGPEADLVHEAQEDRGNTFEDAEDTEDLDQSGQWSYYEGEDD